METTAKKPRLSHLAKEMIRYYEIDTRGSRKYLTQKVCRALLSDAMYFIMLSQYEVESQSGQNKLVDAYHEAAKYLGID